MRLSLAPHPDTPCPAVREIAVEAVRKDADRLALSYRLIGDTRQVRWPEPGPGRRADELWRHTCFEAFVRPQAASAYTEINMAPSGDWAIYGFEDYRAGMKDVEPTAFSFACSRSDEAFDLSGELVLGRPKAIQPWRVAISAVIELIDGSRSYWALAHAPGQPDFHHPDAFTLTLPAESS
jgi:hypothetical protein